jgi:hypothetical protein
LKRWVDNQTLPSDQKRNILSLLEKNGYCSINILKEEDPEILVHLPEIKSLAPGHKIVLKRAFIDLR